MGKPNPTLETPAHRCCAHSKPKRHRGKGRRKRRRFSKYLQGSRTWKKCVLRLLRDGEISSLCPDSPLLEVKDAWGAPGGFNFCGITGKKRWEQQSPRVTLYCWQGDDRNTRHPCSKASSSQQHGALWHRGSKGPKRITKGLQRGEKNGRMAMLNTTKTFGARSKE